MIQNAYGFDNGLLMLVLPNILTRRCYNAISESIKVEEIVIGERKT